jgi:phosphate-selective porin OprO/OprP
LRRLRPAISGQLGGRFEFSVMPDFGGGTAVVQDGWVDTRFSHALRLRVGKMKAPAGLERLTSATGLLFVERAFPTALLPNRDVGLQVHGDVAGGRLSYSAGVFNGVTDGGSGDVDAADGKDLVGRVWLQPFRTSEGHALRGLGLGVSATTGRQTGPLATYRSNGQLGIFSYASGVSADGIKRRWSPQASWAGGPARVLFEYARSTSRLRKDAVVGEVDLRAWQIAGGVLVTGEPNVWGPIEPKDPWAAREAGKGALELAARYTAFEAGAEAFALGFAERARAVDTARELTVGLNWWLTRAVKYVLDYSHTTFEGGAAAGADRKAESALLVRVQVAF